VFLDLEGDSRQKSLQRIFRYEIMWEREPSLSDEIQLMWNEGAQVQDLGDISASLKQLGTSLRRWSHDKFGAVTKEIATLRERIEELSGQNLGTDCNELDQLRKRMDEILYQEEMMWLQRSRISWLREGDQNTKFFHRKVAGRAKKNKIKLLKKEDGVITKDKKEMESLARSFFSDLYKADPDVNPQAMLQLYEPTISPEMNEMLYKEFSEQEIGGVLFQMGPLKAPGLDGFPARFFQRNWELMKADVIRGVRHFFDSSVMPPGVNETAIVLILKKEQAEMLKDYRPISLCNVIYKVVSKCMVNRLRPLLQDIIAPMQSAFIPGRLITDNALIAFECLHAINQGNSECKRFGVDKLDLTKVYDRVDWIFLEGALRRLGFHSIWILRSVQ
jgi:hypothetical protein